MHQRSKTACKTCTFPQLVKSKHNQKTVNKRLQRKIIKEKKN